MPRGYQARAAQRIAGTSITETPGTATPPDAAALRIE
jgi:hypothetical protein